MKISIVTINYNNAAGLLTTVKSVINQTYKDYQFIVIDGGSNDNSLKVIEDYKNKISYWISERDRGIYNAMNKGIDVSIGEYTIFMNSGDKFFDNNVLQNCLPYLDGVDMVYGNTVYSDGERKYSLDSITFKSLYAGSLCHQSCYIKTELLKKYHYDESLKIVSDWKFFLQTLILSSATYKGIDVFVSLYDVSGFTFQNMTLFEEERQKVLTEMFPSRILRDMYSLTKGDTREDKLYIDIKRSSYHRQIYAMIVLMLRFFSLFKRGTTWIKEYDL